MWKWPWTRRTTSTKIAEAAQHLSSAILKVLDGEPTAALVFIGKANALLEDALNDLR